MYLAEITCILALVYESSLSNRYINQIIISTISVTEANSVTKSFLDFTLNN